MGPSKQSHRPWEFAYLICFGTVVFLREYDWSIFKDFPNIIADVLLASPFGYILTEYLEFTSPMLLFVASLEAILLYYLAADLYYKNSTHAYRVGFWYFSSLLVAHIFVILNVMFTDSLTARGVRISLTYPMWLLPGFLIFRDDVDLSIDYIVHLFGIQSKSNGESINDSKVSDVNDEQIQDDKDWKLNEHSEIIEDNE